MMAMRTEALVSGTELGGGVLSAGRMPDKVYIEREKGYEGRDEKFFHGMTIT
jgi:hypothetical protein